MTNTVKDTIVNGMSISEGGEEKILAPRAEKWGIGKYGGGDEDIVEVVGDVFKEDGKDQEVNVHFFH